MSDGPAKWRDIGDRLRRAREYLELTQEEAAGAIGLSRSALSLVENGRRKVDAVELARFAEVYAQSIESLTGAAATGPLPENVQALARAAKTLSASDRDELLRFAEFLRQRSRAPRDG